MSCQRLFAALLCLISTALGVALHTLSWSSSRSTNTSLASATTRSTNLATLPLNNSNLSQSLNKGFYERGPVAFSSEPNFKNEYLIFLAPFIISQIRYASTQRPYRTSDGVIAGQLPICYGSSFVSSCTESVTQILGTSPEYRSDFNWAPTYYPKSLSYAQPTFDRIYEFVNATGVFYQLLPAKLNATLTAIFIGCNYFAKHGGTLPAVMTTALTDIACTVAPTPTTTTSACPILKITYPNATPTPIIENSILPAGDPGCRRFNPKVSSQPAGYCEQGLEFEGCIAAASSNLASFTTFGGPISSLNDMTGFFRAMSQMKPIGPPAWNATFMRLLNCEANNALDEGSVITAGYTSAACQNLPTLAGAVLVTVGQGLCVRGWFEKGCNGGYKRICSDTCQQAWAPASKYGTAFTSFDVVAS